MKNKTYLKIMGVFFASMILFISCKKDEPVKLSPNVATLQILDITDNSAKISGFVIAEGDGLSERGVCYSITETPTTADQKVVVEKGKTSAYEAQLTSLNYTTKYYVRAYVIETNGTTLYGLDTSFTTAIRLPVVSIVEISGKEGKSAICGGNVTDIGGGTISARGVCWSTHPNPTIKNDSTINGTGLGEFVSKLTKLVGRTAYYVRAYAINEAGAGYSEVKSFTTLYSTPVVTTDSIKGIGKTVATAYGNALFTGGTSITTRGFCWGTSENPTTANDYESVGSGIGKFNANLTGLIAGTKYHIRAYATNSQGTEYGKDISIETIGEFFLVGSINGWNNHGLYMEYKGDGVFVAYQYLTNGDEFKFFPIRDTWDNGWGAQGGNCGTAGTAVLGGGNICTNNQGGYSNAGFYEIKFNAINQTVVLTPISVMGVIGNAQAGSWDTDMDLTYDNTPASPTYKRWIGQVNFLGTGEYKFRANHGWDINFGANLANLTSGGSNFISPTAGTYDIILDLGGTDNFNATVTLVKK